MKVSDLLDMNNNTFFTLILVISKTSAEAWIPKGVSRVSADPFIPPPPARRPQTLSNYRPYQQYPRQPEIITANFSQVPKIQASVINVETPVSTYNVHSTSYEGPVSSFQSQAPVSSYQTPIRNPEVPLFGYQVPKETPFGCYRGERGQYSKCKCENCIVGVTCMCLKAKNVPRRGDVLDCHTISQSNSLVKMYQNSMTEICFTNKYQGHMTSICYCNSPFCNGSQSIKSLNIFFFVSALLIMCRDLSLYL